MHWRGFGTLAISCCWVPILAFFATWPSLFLSSFWALVSGVSWFFTKSSILFANCPYTYLIVFGLWLWRTLDCWKTFCCCRNKIASFSSCSLAFCTYPSQSWNKVRNCWEYSWLSFCLWSCWVFQICSIFWFLVLKETLLYLACLFPFARRVLLTSAPNFSSIFYTSLTISSTLPAEVPSSQAYRLLESLGQ